MSTDIIDRCYDYVRDHHEEFRDLSEEQIVRELTRGFKEREARGGLAPAQIDYRINTVEVIETALRSCTSKN